MTTPGSPQVSHRDVAQFADNKVNIKLEIVQKHRKQVAGVREKVHAFIADHPDYGLLKMLESGSLAKGTALRTINDIDVAVYVEAATAPADEVKLLDWLTERLREAYPTKDPQDIAPQTHVVRIHFRGSGLDVDVAPVHYDGDDDDKGHLIDRSGHRVLTSIPLHLRFIRARKAAQHRHFAQLVRLIKWWAAQRKAEDGAFRFRSFLIEMICAHLHDTGVDLSRYPEAMESMFRYVVKTGLRERISFTDYYAASSLPASTMAAIEVFDPVNPDNNVAHDYNDADRQRLVDRAEESLDALAEARFATTKGRALDCWRRVLGPGFGR